MQFGNPGLVHASNVVTGEMYPPQTETIESLATTSTSTNLGKSESTSDRFKLPVLVQYPKCESQQKDTE